MKYGSQIECGLRSDYEKNQGSSGFYFALNYFTYSVGFGCDIIAVHSLMCDFFNYFQFNRNNWFPDSRSMKDAYLYLQNNRE